MKGLEWPDDLDFTVRVSYESPRKPQKVNSTLLLLKQKPYHYSYHSWAHLISPPLSGQCASCILASSLSNCTTSVGTYLSFSKSANKSEIMLICLENLVSAVLRFSFNLWISNCLPFSVFSHIHVSFFSNYDTSQRRYCTWWPMARWSIFHIHYRPKRSFFFGNLAACLLCVLPYVIHSRSNCISRKIHPLFP